MSGKNSLRVGGNCSGKEARRRAAADKTASDWAREACLRVEELVAARIALLVLKGVPRCYINDAYIRRGYEHQVLDELDADQ